MTMDIADELVAYMTPDNQVHAAGPYAERMAGVEDCLDVLDIYPDDDPPSILSMWWQSLSAWYAALDSFDSAASGDDLAADAFLRYETSRYMAKRHDVVEAIAHHFSGADYKDPQWFIGSRGTPLICLSNSFVDYDDAAGHAIRTIRGIRRAAKAAS